MPLIFILMFTMASGFSSTLFRAKNVQILDNKTDVYFESAYTQFSIKKNTCSDEAVKSFVKKIESSFMKSPQDEEGVRVSFKQKEKSIAPYSDMGLFVNRIDQEFTTLKKETELLCKH